MEPVAIVGMGALYPGVSGVEGLWQALVRGKPRFEPVGERRWPQRASVSLAEEFWGARQASLLEQTEIDLARFGIPPVQRSALARLQVLMVACAEQCLNDAGYPERELPAARTDVYCGACFGLDRHLLNALRVQTSLYADDLVTELRARGVDPDVAKAAGHQLERVVAQKCPGSPHDRVGEMVSTIPARIAAVFKLRGRTVALESADATSFVALEQAQLSLSAGVADAALVVVGQRLESALLFEALAAKGLLTRGAPSPLSTEGTGWALGEGVGAVLLKRLSQAVADGDRIYATLAGIGLAHEPRRGTFRYPMEREARKSALGRALEIARVPASALEAVECWGTGIGDETRSELDALAEALGGARPTVPVSSVKAVLGHTIANAGLAAVQAVALQLKHGTRLPFRGENPGPLPSPLSLEEGPVPWPQRPGEVRYAGVNGASWTGGACHLVLAGAELRPSPPPALGRSGIAVIGFGARFSQAQDAAAFWENSHAIKDTIRPLPDEVFRRSAYYDPSGFGGGRSYTEVGSRLEVPPGLPENYRITPKRLARMDVAQRMALWIAIETFARANRGLGERLPGRGLVAIASNLCLNAERTAFAGLELPMLEEALEREPSFKQLPVFERNAIRQRLAERWRTLHPSVTSASVDGYLASGIAAVVINELGLNAVPLAIEAACASSLAAVDVGSRAVATGAYDWALVGGVELATHPREMVLCSALRLLSPTRISPFAETANGFSPGDGFGMFLLRREEDARRDGDPIHAKVRAVGASNDARSLIAPDVEGQALAMRRAFEAVDYGPESVQYVEAHGTGTELGDQTEVRSISSVYGGVGRSQPLAIGSVKSMIGHTFAAAGSAGMLRAILGMKAGVLPPTWCGGKVNPKLVLDQIPGFITTEVSAWPEASPRRAAVSSFGTGGINYHVLLEHPGAKP